MNYLTDVDVSYWLTEWCKEVKLDPKTVTFKVNHNAGVVHIFTSRPGIMIGAKGVHAAKYKHKLTELLQKCKIKKEYSYQFVEVTFADFWVKYQYADID